MLAKAVFVVLLVAGCNPKKSKGTSVKRDKLTQTTIKHPMYNRLQDNVIAIPSPQAENKYGMEQGHLTDALSLVDYSDKELCIGIMFREVVGPGAKPPQHLKMSYWRKAFLVDGKVNTKALIDVEQQDIIAKKRTVKWPTIIPASIECANDPAETGRCVPKDPNAKPKAKTVLKDTEVDYLQAPSSVCIKKHGITAETKQITLRLQGKRIYNFSWNFRD